jgi:hypothetical protein
MYKTIEQYLGFENNPKSNLMEPYKNINYPNLIKEKFRYTYANNPEQKPVKNSPLKSKHILKTKWTTKKYNNINDPKFWGPSYWFNLHISAAHYPLHPSPIMKERTKGRILAIPFEIICIGCKPHACAYIEQHRHRLDKIVSSREELFKFYCDFHNEVNKRYGKPVIEWQDAMKMYTGSGTVTTMSY